MEIMQVDSLAIHKAEIDIQVSTAKQYPRDLKSTLASIETIATLDQETAADCFYSLKRGYGNDATMIEGPSVRMAEIVAGCYGNLRVGTQILSNDGKQVRVQGVCHDLENNVAVSIEVVKSITNKQGKTYSEDMQVTTTNAASAVAFRNALFKVIPKAVTNNVFKRIKDVAIGKANELETNTHKLIKFYNEKIGVCTKDLLTYCEAKDVASITMEQFALLQGTAKAIHEGTTTVKETFGQPSVEEKKEEMKKKQTKIDMP